MEENLKCNKGDSYDCMVPTQTSGTVFPQIIAGDDYLFFLHKKGPIIQGKAIISNIASSQEVMP